MKPVKNQFVQLAGTALTLALILGALAMVWPGIIALFLGALLLIQSFSADQKIAMLSGTEINYLWSVFGLFWRPDLPAILS